MQQFNQELLEDRQFILYKNVLKQVMLKHLNNYSIYDEVNMCHTEAKHRLSSIVEEIKSKSSYVDLPQLIEGLANRLVITQSWQIGGKSGGSYAETAKPYVLSLEERQPKMPFILEDFLAIVAPQLTLIDYREMLATYPIEEKEVEKADYYSNSQIYQMKSINMLPIFDFLKERDLLLNASQLQNSLDNNLHLLHDQKIKIKL